MCACTCAGLCAAPFLWRRLCPLISCLLVYRFCCSSRFDHISLDSWNGQVLGELQIVRVFRSPGDFSTRVFILSCLACSNFIAALVCHAQVFIDLCMRVSSTYDLPFVSAPAAPLADPIAPITSTEVHTCSSATLSRTCPRQLSFFCFPSPRQFSFSTDMNNRWRALDDSRFSAFHRHGNSVLQLI